MIGLRLTNGFGRSISDFKRGFFDRREVVDKISLAERKVLSKAGAFVRKAAQQMIRTKPNSSKPGNPPHNHTGLLRKWILFAYDEGSRSVVVGPAKLNKRGTAPSTLEYGGKVVVRTKRIRERRRANRDERHAAHMKGRKVSFVHDERIVQGGIKQISPRPYMQPGLEKALNKLPPLWRDAVKG